MIIEDKDITSKWGDPPHRELSEINEIVIHHTAGNGNWSDLKKWILSDTCERKDQFKKFVALTHFYIDKDGKITQIYDLDTWTYHSCSGRHDAQTIGIELVHSNGDFKDDQYNALINIIISICDICDIKQIVSHDYNYLKYSHNSKGCPSKYFDWNKLNEMLKIKNLNIILKGV
jgi:hypothetical protein